MSENDRKLLAEVLRCARAIANEVTDIYDIDDVEEFGHELQSALDRYDLRAEDRIA